jgi:hypothetical protein
VPSKEPAWTTEGGGSNRDGSIARATGSPRRTQDQVLLLIDSVTVDGKDAMVYVDQSFSSFILLVP